MDTITLIQAAMFAAIGTATKFSRSGHSVVFATPQLGRNDLAGDDAVAAAQARAAGLDIEAVTDEQVAACQDWHSRMHEDRRVNGARIIITRKFGMERGRELIPANRVAVIDGWGNELGSIAVPCRDYWSPTTRNNGGTMGAFCFEPDYDAVERAIGRLRLEHPDLAEAPVQDNNRERTDG